MAFDSKEYYRKNKERINEYNRQYFKTYYQKNKAKMQARQFEYKGVKTGGCIIKCNVTVSF